MTQDWLSALQECGQLKSEHAEDCPEHLENKGKPPCPWCLEDKPPIRAYHPEFRCPFKPESCSNCLLYRGAHRKYCSHILISWNQQTQTRESLGMNPKASYTQLLHRLLNHPTLRRWSSVLKIPKTRGFCHNSCRKARKIKDRMLDILKHCRIDNYQCDNRSNPNLLSLMDHSLHDREARHHQNSRELSFNSYANLFRQIATKWCALGDHLSDWFLSKIMSFEIYWFLMRCERYLWMWHMLDKICVEDRSFSLANAASLIWQMISKGIQFALTSAWIQVKCFQLGFHLPEKHLLYVDSHAEGTFPWSSLQ